MNQNQSYSKDNYKEIRRVMSEIQKNTFNSYGYRRMTQALHDKGYTINHKVVQRLMKEEGLCCKKRCKQAETPSKSFSTYSKKFGKEGKDLVNRDFQASSFGEKWATDITEIHMTNRKAYLSIVVDMFNSEIVGYCISDEADLVSVLKALDHAHFKHPDVHPIVHSDRGWFYRTNAYIDMLRRNGYTRSMTENGSCYDNAVAESFFAQLKTELIYPRKWKYFKELCRAIHNYIEFYNKERLKASLGYKSPVAYRLSGTADE